MKKRLLLLLPMAALAVAIMGVPTASASLLGVETGTGNPACDGFKVDGTDGDVVDGTYWFGDAWFDVNVYWTANGPAFDWASNLVVTSVTVKGGTMYNVYMYSGDHYGHGLHSPDNPNNKNGKWYGLSHICFEGAKKTGS